MRMVIFSKPLSRKRLSKVLGSFIIKKHKKSSITELSMLPSSVKGTIWNWLTGRRLCKNLGSLRQLLFVEEKSEKVRRY